MPYSLRLLGALDLRDDAGQEQRAVLVAPKRLALLAYLAVATPTGFHRRDRLLALLWSDLTLDRARQALRSTLHKLRQLLGEGVIVSRGADELALAPETLHCDARECERALDEGRLEDACALYAGDLLAGFWLSDAPEFERWLEDRRAALRHRILDAFRRLAERESAAGRHGAAAGWARRAVAIAPDDEDALRRLMDHLDRADDRAGALTAYREFARRLVAAADSVVRAMPPIFPTWLNIEVARLHAALGDLPLALAALRRRPDHFAYTGHLATSLAEEGEVAARLGERREAARAWRHHLGLREDAEPSVEPEVRRIAAALDGLREGEARP
jgi:serine/threonine-protein kinase